jgi:DNA-binding HxlR family transcriptional regulator
VGKYGQFCPVAKSLEILGDQWTLLIVRDMLYGVTHFNDLERGLPGISRGVLSKRLRQLQQAGVIEKRQYAARRQSTAYVLTQAGLELHGVMMSLMAWGERWAFREPEPDELDPVLLMWWLRSDVNPEKLPPTRVVVQFEFLLDRKRAFWLVMTKDDVTLCLTDPGFEVDVVATADVAALYRLWWGQVSYAQAVRDHGLSIEGPLQHVREFASWFNWSAAQAMVELRSQRGQQAVTHRGDSPEEALALGREA